MKHPSKHSHKPLPLRVDELSEYLEYHPLDCTKNSRQLIREYGSIFRCYVGTGTLVIAALLAGYAVLPKDGGHSFTFCKVAG